MNTNRINLGYLFLLSPLHTGGTTQEGNLLGIARESHTKLPYIPSSSIRGRLRSLVKDQTDRFLLFGNEISEGAQLEQGTIWIGDGAILWIPIPSLSHGIIWISSPFLLQRWGRLKGGSVAHKDAVPKPYSTNIKGKSRIYLKDVILKNEDLSAWEDDYDDYIPVHDASTIQNVLVLPDQFIDTIVQMSLWRQVKIKLDEHKTVDGGFRYEEAIPPDTMMYFSWGVTTQVRESSTSIQLFEKLLKDNQILQIGGQESLGRGFVHLSKEKSNNV